MIYELLLKSSDEAIDRIHSDSLENATLFFIRRKQMDEKTFNKLYEVKENGR
tara:strand:+ start:448 stop:603 length:156 start_codon:yes stop_codon:yes gene_type:complete